MRFFSLLIFLLGIVFSFNAHAAPPVIPGSFIQAASAIIYDMDNEAILFEQNADMPIQPASLTKVMSMFLALDYIAAGHARKDALVPISQEAATAGGSSMGLRAGEKTELKKLLMGMAVSSGNDASYAVAEHIGGSAQTFIKMMNARAKQLGMNDTHFVNPHGLPNPDQYTTARDMLTLARSYLHAHPQALEWHNTKTLTHGGYTTWNKNPLLGQYPGADGLKTGWVRASGHNLIFTAVKNGRRLLGVILGAPDASIRGAEACRLLDAGFLVCQNNVPTLTAALDLIPADLSRIDVRKTAKEAGIFYPARHYNRFAGNKRLLATKKLLKQQRARLSVKKNGKKSNSLASRSKNAKNKNSEIASSTVTKKKTKNNQAGIARKNIKRNSHAATKTGSRSAKRS